VECEGTVSEAGWRCQGDGRQ